MKKHPLLITAPHSYATIPPKFRKRIRLNNYEIWQMHDPFTDETSHFPNAFAIHKAKNHRILVDLNRDVDSEDLFRQKDFYGRRIWKSGESLTKKEKEEMKERYWHPFREEIKESLKKMSIKGIKKILYIDHHNTATDHAANRGQYLPPINLGNYGDQNGEFCGQELSASPSLIMAFRDILNRELPELSTEVNKVYKGSSLIRFVKRIAEENFPNLSLEAIHLEYNLNLIVNPLSQKIDQIAKGKFKKALNQSILDLIHKHL